MLLNFVIAVSTNSVDCHLKSWGGFEFKRINPSNYPDILEHLNENFYKDEPMKEILGVTKDRITDMDSQICHILNLNQGSFFAYPAQNPTMIASVLIIWVQETEKTIPLPEALSPLTTTTRMVLQKLTSRYNIHAEHNLTAYPEIFVASTARQFRGKGLATEMYRKAIIYLREQGYPLVASTFTSHFTRKIGIKLGFKEVARLDFDECKHEDGSLVFGEKGEKHFITETLLNLQLLE